MRLARRSFFGERCSIGGGSLQELAKRSLKGYFTFSEKMKCELTSMVDELSVPMQTVYQGFVIPALLPLLSVGL